MILFGETNWLIQIRNIKKGLNKRRSLNDTKTYTKPQ